MKNARRVIFIFFIFCMALVLSGCTKNETERHEIVQKNITKLVKVEVDLNLAPIYCYDIYDKVLNNNTMSTRSKAYEKFQNVENELNKDRKTIETLNIDSGLLKDDKENLNNAKKNTLAAIDKMIESIKYSKEMINSNKETPELNAKVSMSAKEAMKFSKESVNSFESLASRYQIDTKKIAHDYMNKLKNDPIH